MVILANSHAPAGNSEMPSILIIDDDRSIRHLVQRTFDGSDIEVREAATAEAGLDMLHTNPPDVVLLDIGLPEM